MELLKLSQELYQSYENYKEKTLTHRRFKHKDVSALLSELPFKSETIGKSFEGRPIKKITFGEGKIKVLLWSQMHGNEATATMALFDILNFLNSNNDTLDSLRLTLKEKLEIHLVPMLNPDGAERFIRRTAQGIDMNRDAVALKCPESKLLKDLVFSIKPDFSFNLHDQNVRYSVGETPEQATMSFLATAYNTSCDWNETRTRSHQVITDMNDVLQKYIPGAVGRFSDEFEPRAFGDNIQAWGSSLILVESGGYGSDSEKMYIRKLNFVCIISALASIATETYTKNTLENYLAIPQNSKNLFNLKIKNASIKVNENTFKVDLGINTEEKNINAATNYVLTSVIEDLGDLSVFFGIEEFDAKGALIESVLNYPDLIKKYNIKSEDQVEIAEGNTATFVINGRILVLNGQIIS